MKVEMQENRNSLQKVMENFIDPSTYKHFLIFNGHKLETDSAYTQIYGMAKKSIMQVECPQVYHTMIEELGGK